MNDAHRDPCAAISTALPSRQVERWLAAVHRFLHIEARLSSLW